MTTKTGTGAASSPACRRHVATPKTPQDANFTMLNKILEFTSPLRGGRVYARVEKYKTGCIEKSEKVATVATVNENKNRSRVRSYYYYNNSVAIPPGGGGAAVAISGGEWRSSQQKSAIGLVKQAVEHIAAMPPHAWPTAIAILDNHERRLADACNTGSLSETAAAIESIKADIETVLTQKEHAQ